jgi:hypothetical protein
MLYSLPNTMTTSQPTPEHPTTNPEPIVSWLREHELALPAWIFLSCVQPFGWILGQGCLLLEPLGRGLGWGEHLTTAIGWMDNPAALTALVEQLAPDQERH